MGGREEGEYTSERAGGVELAAAAAVRRLHGSNDSNDYELVTSPRCEIVNSRAFAVPRFYRLTGSHT